MRHLIVLLAAGIAIAAPPVIDGVEFLIDTTSGPSPHQQEDPAVAFDGTNYLVAWEDYRNGSYDIYAARVTPAGAVLDPRGFAVSTAADEHRNPAVAFDGANFLVAWEDWRGGQNPNIYGARVTPGGVVLDTAGIAITTATAYQESPSVAFDGTNWLVAWQDNRSGFYQILVARVSPAGAVLDTAGIPVTNASRQRGSPSVAFDGTNSLVVWNDSRNTSTSNDIYCARVSPDGEVLEPNGIPVSRAPRSQTTPGVAFGDSLFLTAWQDDRASDYNIHAARITPQGGVLDTAGIPVCTVPRQQYKPALAFDGTEFIAAWEDARGGANSDIYGARITTDGVVYDEQLLATRTGSRFDPDLARGPGSQVMLVYQGYTDTVGGRTYNKPRTWCKLGPLTGVEEPAPRDARRPTLNASIVRGVLHLPVSSFGFRNSSLVDAAGRRLLDLSPGPNDVSRLAPGVYFIIQAEGLGVQGFQGSRVVISR